MLEDGFVEADAPFQNSGSFGMFFFGGDKKVRRTFSGYLFLEKNELITIYVEGVGVAPKEHLLTFQTIVKSLKRRQLVGRCSTHSIDTHRTLSKVYAR